MAKVFETLKHHTKHVTNHTFISSIPKKPQLCLDYQTMLLSIHVNSFQGTIGCTPNSVPMVFIVFSRDSWGL